MSPILVRPVREQLEHDRVIRLLQAKSRRKYEVVINPGNERNAAVGTGPTALYPDLLLQSLERGHRLQAVIEVETGESVNHLEALSQWTHLARLRVPFHLYVPAGSVDSAKRLCADMQIQIAELWSYNAFGDQIRFTLVNRTNQPEPKGAAKPAKSAAPRARAAAPAPARAAARRPAAAVARRKPAVAAKAKAAPVRRGAAKAASKSARSAKVQKRR